MYIHMINSKIAGIIVKNKTDYAIQIPKKLRLRTLQEMNYENVFFAKESKSKRQSN